MRGMRANYDSYLQVFNRLEQYIVLGHDPEKIEVIVMGGTVLAVPDGYIEDFTKYIYKAMNDFSTLFYTTQSDRKAVFDMEKFKEYFLLPGDIHDPKRKEAIHTKLLAQKQNTLQDKTQAYTCTLEEEQKKNETAHVRCVGLTIETKPDWGFLEHGNRMLALGCTRVELGVQTTFEEPLILTHRGHSLNNSIESIRTLKDLGFKLNFHYMPGLPGVAREKEVEGFKQLFASSDFQPDMLKIYPCMVMPGTLLYDDYKAGKYTPLETKEAAELIAEFMRYVPKYCRVMRVQRDIPTYRTEAGVDRTNLRQYLEKVMQEKGIVSNDIRAREIKGEVAGEWNLKVIQYDASHGKEFFIEAVTEDDKLLGYCRMRYPSQALRKEITMQTALIRELHVYGPATALQKIGKVQHKGVGKALLQKAEEIAKHDGKNKIVVISGVGVREYYYKQGYEKEGVYVVKGV
jgi:elongator complex protein 3